MGTASTMTLLAEALGLALLPGTAAIPAPDSHAGSLTAEETGRSGSWSWSAKTLTPAKILTPAAFHNAIRVMQWPSAAPPMPSCI